jgi:hypothetical protein
LGSSLPPAELASVGFRRFRGNKIPIFHYVGGEKRWQKSKVFISEKLQPDAGPDAVQGGPARPVSSNRRQRHTREGRGSACPVPRGTEASGHTPSGQRVSQCRSDAVASPVTCDRTRPITRGALWTPIGRRGVSDCARSSLDSDRTPGAARPVKRCSASGHGNGSL